MKTSNILYSLLIIIAVVVILVYGKTILLPFVLAIMVWFLIKVVRNFVKKFKIKNWHPPKWLQNIISFILIFGLLGGIGQLLSLNIQSMNEALPVYEENINVIVAQINERFGIDIFDKVDEFTGEYDFSSLLSGIINSISEIFGNAFMVILYVLFLMLEESIFPKKIRAIFKEEERYLKAKDLLQRLNKSINEYISLKTLVSLITAAVSYVVLLIIGVDFAFFWAFLIFMLNFIPTIGSLVATIFPATMALLQYTSINPFIWVLVCIGAVQLTVGNFLEPKIMGKSLNVSPLVVLLALASWGAIWGIVGMILSVPITVVMIIIFAQFPATRSISVLLSSNANVK